MVPILQGQAQRLWHLGQQLGRHGLDFLFPPACLLCGIALPAQRVMLCPPCRAELGQAMGPACRRCAAPVGPHLEQQPDCPWCRSENYPFGRVFALGAYEGTLRATILAGKQFQGLPIMAMLSDLLIDRHLIDLWSEPIDAVIPMPHHWQRRFWKIHSASETIAERVAGQLGRPYAADLLQQVRLTRRQSESTPAQRRQQQRQAFAVAAGRNLAGARLLLVDDVLTTGATATAATRTLLKAGASHVLVAVLARAIGQQK